MSDLDNGTSSVKPGTPAPQPKDAPPQPVKRVAPAQPVTPVKPPWEIYVYGVWVTLFAIAALAVVASVLVLYTRTPARDIAFIMGSVASPIVAIASAYFGISAAGRAAAAAHDVAGKAIAAKGQAKTPGPNADRDSE